MTDGSYCYLSTTHLIQAVQVTMQRMPAVCEYVLDYIRSQNSPRIVWDYLSGNAEFEYRCKDIYHDAVRALNDAKDVALALQEGKPAIEGNDFIVNSEVPCVRCGSREVRVGYSHKGKRIAQCTQCSKWRIRKVKVTEVTEEQHGPGFLHRLRCAIRAFIEAKDVA